jgi:rSAM/selenodomain-associated transferase 1
MSGGLAIMCRSPRRQIETLKTRLARAVPDPRDRARLYRAFLQDTVAMARHLCQSRALRIAYTPADAEGDFDELGAGPSERFPQRGHDIGARERAVFAELFGQGIDAVVLVGSDLPTLPRAHVEEAFALLARPDLPVVLGPATDGGYYLIGLSREAAPFERLSGVFEGIRWSTPHAFEDTRAAARGAGLAVATGPGWYDVDDEEGLTRLRQDLRDPGVRAAAPATAREMDRLFPGTSAL